ncbi:uncharacterized protein LACBIDRAFT_334508 [Laccaria bicolor S238N-H82]|uniref:Predicted protein n=1 Tax=Laccaria bicolor (strain S238N-H82 / ATCC MYA-4686) TaxID=486041 RepID=B0DZE2_LACBS|nr:uncharacterized protein LACBIDRAFT_334508 [Laccaria bicolor S238N-H82]EDR00029.1 predicted protein [Laccaria bicolor S238N-H82]|eukprot:XP_001889338.1 predicted protein [Laccaria bicolor S238N-H82]
MDMYTIGVTLSRKFTTRAFVDDRGASVEHLSTSISMSGSKCAHDENLPATPQNRSFTFVDGFAPKKPRLSAKNARQFTSQEIQNIQRDREAQRLTQAREKEELVARKKEELDVEQLKVVWQSIRDMAIDWALSTTAERIESEWKVLVREFQPGQGAPITDILARFSLQRVLAQTQVLAPTLYDLLQRVSGSHESTSVHKDRNLIVATTICMLVKSRNDHASKFQTTMCMYFLACGASRSLFDVLNHAGLTLSYAQAVAKLKQLGAERLEEMPTVSHTQAVMIIWDNLNIAFNVTEQRHDSKAHFDNGTTATLIPLFGVEFPT